MTQLSDFHQPARGRIFPKSNIPPEELARRRAKRVEIGERCRAIFDRVRPELIDQYYNWFIAIEPESGHYLIDKKLDILLQKVRGCYPNKDVKWTTFRLNETGACGQIWLLAGSARMESY